MHKMCFKVSVTVLLTSMITGCQMTSVEQEKTRIQQTVSQSLNTQPVAQAFSVPNDVAQQLMPSQLTNDAALVENRFDIAAKDVDVRSFFSSLVEQTPYSVVFERDVSGELSLNLNQVTLNEVLEVVASIYGLVIEKKGQILQVSSAAISTQTFSFNYLLLERKGTSQTSISSGGITQGQNGSSGNSSNSNSSSSSNGNSASGGNNSVNGTYIESTTDTNYWQELEQTLTAMIEGEGRKVILSPHAGLVTVIGYPKDVSTVKTFLDHAQENLHRQVILEARIIEVTLSDGYQQGIEWQKLLSYSGTTDFNFSTSSSQISNVVSTALGGVSSLSFSNTDFSGVVSLLSTQGDVNVLSSPRTTAINNQKAVIKVGSDEYFVTDVSSSSSNVGDSVVSNPEVELTPFFSGIALDVTPQIDEDNNVLLHVHPSVIEVVEQLKTIELQDGTFQLPLAKSAIRETDTVIRAASGDVVVIGGLMSSRTTDNESKVPLLGSIPILGELFTNRKEQVQKTELIILIKPTVVGKGTWKKQLQRSQSLLEKWYPE